MKRLMSILSVLFLAGCSVIGTKSTEEVLINPNFSKEDFFKAVKKGELAKVKAMLNRKPEMIKARFSGEITSNIKIRDNKTITKTGTCKNWTALHIAAVKAYKDVAKLLIEKGADVNAQSKEEFTPLHGALLFNKVETAKLLLESGAEINAKNKQGQTPLHIASAYHKLNMVKLLIKKGADVKAKDIRGWRPLHAASVNDKLDTVKLLIEKGADINAKNKQGQTPLDVARTKEMRELLRKHGAK